MTFKIQQNDLMYTQKTHGFLFNKEVSHSVSGLAYFHSYSRYLIDDIFSAYTHNPALPIVYFAIEETAYERKFKEEQHKGSISYHTYDLFEHEETDDIDFKKIKSQIINKGISAFYSDSSDSNRISLHRSIEEVCNNYKNNFFTYLKAVEKLMDLGQKTIYMFNIEDGIFNPEEVETIHSFNKKAKDLGHIVIFIYHCYGDIRYYKYPIFGKEKIYEKFIISTMGYGNQMLLDTKDTPIYSYLPDTIQSFFAEQKLSHYLSYPNIYVEQYDTTILKEYHPKKIVCKHIKPAI